MIKIINAIRCIHSALILVYGDEFAAIAEAVHKSIGSPHITLTNSWEIFRKMSAGIENLGNDVV
jgi:hypothetical protein